MKLKRTGMITKILILVLLIAGITTLLDLRGELKDLQAQCTALEQQIDRQTQENESLAASNAGKDDLENIKEVARESLGLMDPGEIDFYDCGN